MPVNKEAVKEIYNREGLKAAGAYLVSHELMSSQEALDYLYEEILDKQNLATTAISILYKGQPEANYYCEEHNEVTSPHPCNKPHGSFIQRILSKVKSYAN